MKSTSEIFYKANTVCVKLGTTRVVDGNLRPRTGFITNLGEGIHTHFQTKRVFCVASGAVALGRSDAGFRADQELSPQEKQIAFGFGHQIHTGLFTDAFGQAGLKPATGHLVAAHNFDSVSQRDNLQYSLNGLLDRGAVVVCNENDLTATDELTLGQDNKWSDNDRLSAELACVMGADVLLILTDVDGVYTAHPNVGGTHISVINHVDEKCMEMASGKGSSISTGGMYSKLKAAQIAQRCGITTIIARGDDNVICDLMADRVKTTIIPPLRHKCA